MRHVETSELNSGKHGSLHVAWCHAALGGRAFADVGCWDSEPPKATKGKCAAGYKYSAKKKACTKVSCGMGRVWSGEEQACIGDHSAALTDQAFYTEARARR
jgi:hypothetical protein